MTLPGSVTHGEIFHQPELWLDTLERVRRHLPPGGYGGVVPVITGAGSSAYAAEAIAASWPGAAAIPTTNLLLDAPSGSLPEFDRGGFLISIARSGDSPESVGVVELVQRLRPRSKHLAIMCNPQGQLARTPGVDAILLDPRTNDRSLAVTSAFSNLALAGISLRHADRLREALPAVCRHVAATLAALDDSARMIAATPVSRVAVLAPPALFGAAREAALKVLEMTDGAVVAMPETFLGLRHGPMTFLREDALVLCLMSTDPLLRRYEEDLLLEIRAKGIGRIVAVAPASVHASLADHVIPANAPDLPDALRTPFEIVFPQLLAYHLSLRLGLNPDVASPRGVINRVVQGVKVHS